jgi:hypothetical protein
MYPVAAVSSLADPKEFLCRILQLGMGVHSASDLGSNDVIWPLLALFLARALHNIIYIHIYIYIYISLSLCDIFCV